MKNSLLKTCRQKSGQMWQRCLGVPYLAHRVRPDICLSEQKQFSSLIIGKRMHPDTGKSFTLMPSAFYTCGVFMLSVRKHMLGSSNSIRNTLGRDGGQRARIFQLPMVQHRELGPL